MKKKKLKKLLKKEQKKIRDLAWLADIREGRVDNLKVQLVQLRKDIEALIEGNDRIAILNAKARFYQMKECAESKMHGYQHGRESVLAQVKESAESGVFGSRENNGDGILAQVLKGDVEFEFDPVATKETFKKWMDDVFKNEDSLPQSEVDKAVKEMFNPDTAIFDGEIH